jgi:hypothetical protein
MKLLAQLVNDPSWQKEWEEYEFTFAVQFLTASDANIASLHAQLKAARDFKQHLEEMIKNEQGTGNYQTAELPKFYGSKPKGARK